MNLPKELTARIESHLSNVRKHLGSFPPDEQKEILQSIEAHIHDALESRSGGEPAAALLDAVLAEMDPPESYGEQPLTKQPGSGMRPFVFMAVALTAALVIWTTFGISKANTISTAESKGSPVVLNTFPLKGSNCVNPNITELQVTFSKDMRTDQMWSWCIESQDTAPKFISGGTKFIDKRTCVTSVILEPNRTYVVWINTQKHNAFRDIDNNPAAPYRLEFRTGNAQSNTYSSPAELTSDPVGHWVTIDFVDSVDQFNPETINWTGDLYLKSLTFQSNGQTDRSFWNWSNGILHHSGDNTDAKFFIKKISGKDYLFLEWINGDVINKCMAPKYYVLKKGSAENLLTSKSIPSKAFLKAVEKPSAPHPPPGKYAFQIIKVTAPAEIIPSPKADVEKIIQSPEAKISEYPTLIAGLGESITNEQIEAMSMDVDWGVVDEKPITKEKTFRLETLLRSP